MPNLEQTGLLQRRLPSTSPSSPPTTTSWARRLPAARATPRRRSVRSCARSCSTSCAASSRSTSTASPRTASSGSSGESRQHLIDPWAIGEDERLSPVGVGIPAAGKAGRPRARARLYVSGRSAFGRYLRRDGRSALRTRLTHRRRPAASSRDLLRGPATRPGLLTQVDGRSDGGPGYRLNAGAALARRRRHQRRARTRCASRFDRRGDARVNPFFRDLYRDLAAELAGLHAREHTAQVPPEDREEREDAVPRRATCRCCTARRPWSSASTSRPQRRRPAQRPAHAGELRPTLRPRRPRGQPALVLTYCSTGNAHDTY